uniref:Uncharacterized protein n=1 Tax=Panagrolaimus superbus TaxID=310955 RepID=A0A914ZC18_9BILA
MVMNLQNSWRIVEENIINAQETYATNADINRKATEKKLHIGQLVLRQIDSKPKDQKHKLAPIWKGPYRVIQIIRPNAVIKELKEEAAPFKIHINKLKAFIEPYVLPFRALTVTKNNEEEEMITDDEEPEAESIMNDNTSNNGSPCQDSH